MFVLKTVILAACLACISSQHNGPTTTPVPILKQINKQNDDGSYSYGYEAADGSFKIETKYPNGDVAGKYGYVDESGKPREISYGASSLRGFEPQGSGIMVPPPTLYDPTSSNALSDGQEDDGQYREDPKIYEDPKYNSRSYGRQQTFRQYETATASPEPQYQRETIRQPAQPQFQPAQYQPRPTQTSQFRSGPLFSQETGVFNQGPQQFPQAQTQFSQPQSQFSQPQSRFSQPQSQFSQPQSQFSQPQSQFPQPQAYRPQSQVYHHQPQFSYQANIPQPQYSGQSYPQNYQSNQNFNPFSGHPAQNFDPNTGSYTIDFTG